MLATREGDREPAAGRARRAFAAVACLTLAACAGCTGPGQERNLAPLFSRHSAAGGAPEIEALGGVVLTRRHPETDERTYWAVRPLVSNRFEENGDRFSWYLPPLGFIAKDAEDKATVAQLLPIARYTTATLASGFVTWSLLVLPGIFWAQREDGRIRRAFFPFGGVVEDFLSLDRAVFVLFPLWFRINRYGRTTDHILFPVFTISHGEGGRAWRVWPLAGHNRWEGRYSRRFFLWPFFHWQHNDQLLPEDEQQRSWMIWPLIGRSRRGDARSTTVAWPFFGYTTDPESGFWAWDGPWPLVVFQGGDPNRAKRERVWPFYSRFQGEGTTSRWYMFPLVNHRHDVNDEMDKRSLMVFPFWRSSDRIGPRGTTKWRKVWPLGHSERGPDGTRFAFPDPNPFWQLDFIEEHYSWLWELYARRTQGEAVRSRSWLGLWRREKDRDENRRSFAFLWSARDYTRAGREVRERSWLLGLLRYRTTAGEGLRLLPPSIPGPGWPMERVPRSIAPAAR